jgi:CspA family cold shock protein
MKVGTVKWYSAQKGYGFIQPEDNSQDVFVHASALEKAGLFSLSEGQKVNYELATNKGRTSAANIQVIN